MQMNNLERRRESRSDSPVSEDHLVGSRNTTSAFSKRSKPYGKVLLSATIVAVLLLLLAHWQREKGVLGLLVEEHELELNSLRAQLQKAKESAEEMKKKMEELALIAGSLKSQKMELSDKLARSEIEANYLQQRKTEMELEQESSQTEMKEVELRFARAKKEIKSLKKDLRRKSDAMESMATRLELLDSSKAENAAESGGGGAALGDRNGIVSIVVSELDQPQNATIVDDVTRANDTLSGDGEPARKMEHVDGDMEQQTKTEEEEPTGNPTEDLYLANKTQHGIPRNSTNTTPEFSAGSGRGENLPVANATEEDRATPVKPKHRTRKMSPTKIPSAAAASVDRTSRGEVLGDFRREEGTQSRYGHVNNRSKIGIPSPSQARRQNWNSTDSDGAIVSNGTKTEIAPPVQTTVAI